MSNGVVQLAEQQLREQAPSAPHFATAHITLRGDTGEPCVSQAAKTYSLLFDEPLPICNSQEQWVEWAEQRADLLDKWRCLSALAIPPAANPSHEPATRTPALPPTP